MSYIFIPKINNVIFILFYVLNQTFKNYELLVIDDCSTDSTMEVIKQVVGQNAKILQTKKNF